MIKLGDDTQNQGNRGGLLYTKACVHALAAGFTDYLKYNSDTDFDSIREDADKTPVGLLGLGRSTSESLHTPRDSSRTFPFSWSSVNAD